MEDTSLVLTRARAAVIARDFTLAARLYKQLLKNDQSNTDLLRELGNLYIKAGQDDEALPLFNKITRLQPGNIPAFITLGGIYRRLKKYDEAIAVLEQALAEGGENAQVSYNLGFTFKDMKKYDDAIRCFEDVIEENPSDVLAFNHLGAIYAQKGEHQKAVNAYSRGLKVDPNHPVLQLNIAKSYEALGERQKATGFYEGALKAKPGWLEAIDSYYNLLLKSGRIALANRVVQTGADLNPDDVKIRTSLGEILNKRAEFPSAEKEFKTALNTKEDYIPAMSGLATSLEAQGKNDEAVQTIEKASGLNPTDEKLLKQAVSVLLSGNHLAAAYKKLTTLWNKDKNDADTLNLLGQYYILNGEKNKAEGCFKRLTSLHPLYNEHLREAAKRFMQIEDNESCEKYLQAAIEKNPRDINAITKLAAIYEQQSKADSAAELYQKAAKIDSGNALVSKGLSRLEADIPDDADTDYADFSAASPEEISKEFDSTGEEIPLAAADEDFEPTEENAPEEEKKESSDDDFDFDQFGMEKLAEDESDAPLFFDDSSMLDDQPKKEELISDDLDDLIDDESPVEADDTEVREKIPDGSEELSVDDSFQPDDEFAVSDSDSEENEGEKRENPSELDGQLKEAQDILDKANYAAEKAWNAAQTAADTAQELEDRKQAESWQESAPETEISEDLPDEIPEDFTGEYSLSEAAKVLPPIVKALAGEKDLEKFARQLKMFKKLREMLEFLPPTQKAEFLSSKTRLLLDYIIAKLSGTPGLYSAAKALINAGAITPADAKVELPDSELELTKTVIADAVQLIPSLQDANLRKVLMQSADELMEKLN